MNKRLCDMTLDELWRLFPIYLTEHKAYWEDWFREEVEFLKTVLPTDTRYYHIGSTAIKGIMAKPIIDILIVVDTLEQVQGAAEILRNCGYIVMSGNTSRISLNKGYTENGFAQKVFHLHIRLNNDKDEIYFKDYLNANPEIAKEYERLKLRLWKEFEHNRDAYTDAKTDFVKMYTELAKKKYVNI